MSQIKHIISEEDLKLNPELVEAGVKVGDEIELTEPNQDELEALTKDYNDLQQSIDELQKENAELKKALADAAKAAKASKAAKGDKKPAAKAAPKPQGIPTELVKHKGKSYRFKAAGMRITGGEVVSAREIAVDPELIDSILEIEGQTILVEVS